MKTRRVSRKLDLALRWWLAAVVVMGPGICLADNVGAAEPAAKPALLLWLDASDSNGNGTTAMAGALAAWSDKSGQAHHARQDAGDQRPVMVPDAAGPGLPAVRFEASRREFLSCGAPATLDLSAMTAFVVARAEAPGGDMWLFSKNQWGSPWTGYGIALSGAQLRPWPHFGLAGGGRSSYQFGSALGKGFRLLEVRFDGDGRMTSGRLDGAAVNAMAVNALATVGTIAPNTQDLTIGGAGVQHLQGDIAEIMLYGRALEPQEAGQTRRYLMDKYGLEAPSALVADWLFQAEGRPLRQRALEEIGWARELAGRIGRDPQPPDLSQELAELDRLAAQLPQAASAGADRNLYLDVRKTKRKIFLKNPAVDFTQLLLIDQPMPQGSEFPHEAVHRLGMMATPGGRLLVTEGLDPESPVRQLAPNQPGSFWRPELSFDARKVLFCFKPADAKSFHLYQSNLDGSDLRQLTDGDYDDIDPIYLPDGHIMFTTTRGNTYVRCGPYIYSNTLARCDADGSNIYLISFNSEPDFVPALLPDGHVVYSRWEYSDKDQNRVQSLWTTRQDGTQTSVFWGNQSYWPDHLAEPRPLPGTNRVMFTSVGHHDWFHGTIGIVDATQGANFPHGLTRVTFDLPWAEVGSSPADRSEAADYHAAGRFTGYMAPYPISAGEFLVSARGEGDRFRVYLMDVHGNRELLHAGEHHAWYAMPVKARPVPPRQPDMVEWPGTGKDRKPMRPGVFYNSNVWEGVPDLPRERVKFLRVIQQEAKTYSTWQKVFVYSGPAVSAVQTEAVKRIISTVPVEADGSVYFEVPAGLAVYFQLLDEKQRALHTMRSFTGLLPGERRGCVGCHSQQGGAPPNQLGLAMRRPPTPVSPPPWGDESIGYERFVQPVLDRHCGKCHQGDGKARAKLDLTLRQASGEFAPFKEPYITLIGQAAWPVAAPGAGRPGYGIAGAIPVYGLRPEDVYDNDRATDAPSTIHRTLRPMRYLSARSPLIERVMSGGHHGVKLDELELQRLIAWVDANCPFLGAEEIRAMPDPDFPGIDKLPIRPRLQGAPVVDRP